MISNKNKPIIQDVEITPEKLEKFNSIIKHCQYKHRVIRHFFGGNCVICANIPSRKIIEDLEGYGQRIEYYCDRCFAKSTVS